MIRCGVAPFLECSSAGDRRFSAFYATPASLDGKSIEHAYQSGKVFANGSTGLHWRKAKGRTAVNQLGMAAKYFQWWREWVYEQNLIDVLIKATGLSDRFGEEGHVCQATTLWAIRCQEITDRRLRDEDF